MCENKELAMAKLLPFIAGFTGEDLTGVSPGPKMRKMVIP